jgi:hypothetical protein
MTAIGTATPIGRTCLRFGRQPTWLPGSGDRRKFSGPARKADFRHFVIKVAEIDHFVRQMGLVNPLLPVSDPSISGPHPARLPGGVPFFTGSV